MGNWDRSSFGFVFILSGIPAAGTSMGAMLHGFSGTGAPYLLLTTAVLTIRSAFLSFKGNATTNVHTRKPKPE